MKNTSMNLVLVLFALLAAIAGPAGAAVPPDYRAWGELLSKHYDPAKGMNYKAFKAQDKQTLDELRRRMATVDVQTLSRQDQLAYWINLYNISVVGIVVDNYPVESIRDLSTDPLIRLNIFKKDLVDTKRGKESLNDIENEKIRERLPAYPSRAVRGLPPLRAARRPGAEVPQRAAGRARREEGRGRRPLHHQGDGLVRGRLQQVGRRAGRLHHPLREFRQAEADRDGGQPGGPQVLRLRLEAERRLGLEIMIGQPRSLRRVVELLRDPATAEKRALLAQRCAGLDPALRRPGQGLGQKATGCGATIGIQPRCDFACTGCYLGHEANHVPALPTAAILRQLDELRRWLGPKSNVQITDGEVTLRPVEELTEILRYARSIGVIPMVMTHGDNLRRQPGLLERLMVEGGLTEISIHVDITQRGRDGYRVPKSELELMPLRDEFAAMVRAARRRTGRELRAAMTLTVTRDNLPQIADVVRWLVHNRDAFGLASFQPLAQVGRTRKNQQGVTADALWREIGRATADFGLELDGTGPIHFGHTECTRLVPLLAIEKPGEEPRLFRAIRDEPEDVAIVQELFEHGLGGVAFRD